MNPKLQWKCTRCESCYEYQSTDLECCPTEVDKVYVCSECGDDYNDLTNALFCCANCDEDVEISPELAHIEMMKQLEENGQQRLF